jgi:transcription-repair coupling factor (superfamily II helicase)
MEGAKLEQVMIDFIAGDFDVLISTTIIESGLDIPNANTIFINNAHHFGLSDMHQLRGRVGRSNKKAFCYLLAPPLSTLTQEARRRLKAIEEFSDLGSGFNIAMQDLDIRGAGNMLGAEQSGFIADIGFETYHRILDEAIQELKQNELSYLFVEDEPEPKQLSLGKPAPTTKSYISDCQIDTDLEVHIPDSYVDNISERIYLYRQLDEISDEKALEDFENNLTDRFGKLPEAAKELLLVVRLRWLAIQAGIEKVVMKNDKMVMYFISNPQSPYYKSEMFGTILQSVQKQPALFRMKEAKDKLTLSVENVRSINEALIVLYKLVGSNN